MRDDGGLDQGDSSGSGQKLSDSGNVMKVEPTGNIRSSWPCVDFDILMPV